MVRRRSVTGPFWSGRRRRVRRRSSGSTRRRISRFASLISAAPIASKSICWSRSCSDTVIDMSRGGGSSLCCGGLSFFDAKASATRREAGGARSGLGFFCASSRAIAAACSAAEGSRQNKAKAWSKTSLCSWRWIIAVRSAVHACVFAARSIWVSASCAAIVSAGPTGSPARRSRRAKCMTLAAILGFGWFSGSCVVVIGSMEAMPSVGARGGGGRARSRRDVSWSCNLRVQTTRGPTPI